MKIKVEINTEEESEEFFNEIKQLFIEQFQDFSIEVEGTDFKFSQKKDGMDKKKSI